MTLKRIQKNDTVINQRVIDCVFLAFAEWAAKINTADLSANMPCQFGDGHD